MVKKRASTEVKPTIPLPDICDALRELQRQRVCNMKSRIMISNRLVAAVATSTGYHAGMDEKERLKRFDEAAKRIKRVMDTNDQSDSLAGPILATSAAIDAFRGMEQGYENEMVKLAKQFPVADWVSHPDQRGFGWLHLANVVGEAGDLNNYANPAKLWKRMGLAPYESRGKNLMPSTWRGTKPGLSAEEWTAIGYSPRRRSIAYLIGDGLVKQNGKDNERVAALKREKGLPVRTEDGPYRRRYSEAKAKIASLHDDYKPLRCDRHGMLLATKMLLLELWLEWTGTKRVTWDGDESKSETDYHRVAVLV